MRYSLIAVFVIAFLFIPQIDALSSNSTNQDIITGITDLKKENQKQLETISNLENKINDTQSLNVKLVSEINDDLIKIQKRNEGGQLLYTSAQVSGIFVAIIGGFFTTKILSMSTERNRLFRQLGQLDSEIRAKGEIIDHHQGTIEDISLTWAEEVITDFKKELLADDEIKNYSEYEIIEKFYEYTYEMKTMPNEYELAVLEDQYNTISQEIRNRIENRKRSFGLLDNFDLSSLISPLSRPNLGNRYREADDQVKLESLNRDQLVSQRKQIESGISDIALPTSVNNGIMCLFVALFIGIVVPLLFANGMDLSTPNVGAIGIVCFLACVIITLAYFGSELQKELLKKLGITSN